MLREQAIFFEVMEDLYISGSTEGIILTYHDFITGFDFSTATDLEIHKRAVEYLKKNETRYRDYLNIYNQKHDILETLNLEDAKWEYRDQAAAAGE